MLTKSYDYEIDLNKKKNMYIETVLYPEWKRVAGVLMKLHMKYLYMNNCICVSNEIYKPVETFFTERYKDAINRQVLGIFKSKISNAKNRYVEVVMNSDLSDECKKDLCLVNKRNIFFVNEDSIGVKYKVDYETIKLGRWIFKSFFGKLPSCKNINMVLQDKICEIQNIETAKHPDFKYMLRLSSGNRKIRGQFYYIPLLKNTYSDKIQGKMNTSCTFVFKKGKFKSVILTKEIEPKETKLNNITLAFDIGTTVLIATNNGECYGEFYLKKLKKLDDELIALQNRLKEKYGKRVKLTNFKEYNDLVEYIREFSKNEINRIINKIFKKYKPTTIIVENLDFKKSNIGRKNNRLLHRFGLGIIKNKLDQLKTEYGVNIVYTDPAYSSQVCDNCKYIDEKNRKTQAVFVCMCCGKKVNADVNGSRTVKYFGERFAEKKFYGDKGRNYKRTLLVDDFIHSKVWMDDKRIIQTMDKNPYFKEYGSLFREILEQMSYLS